MKLTEDNLREASTTNHCISMNCYQLRLLGVSWPPTHGWIKRLVGKEIDDRSWQCIIELRRCRHRDARKKVLKEFGATAKSLFSSVETFPKLESPTAVPTIHYPKKVSEFEIQATLFSKLGELGLDVRGEVLAKTVDFGKRVKVSLDLVVFSTMRTPIAIIECKNRIAKLETNPIGPRQFRRYSSFNVPLLACDRMSAIDGTIQKIEEIIMELDSFDAEKECA